MESETILRKRGIPGKVIKFMITKNEKCLHAGISVKGSSFFNFTFLLLAGLVV